MHLEDVSVAKKCVERTVVPNHQVKTAGKRTHCAPAGDGFGVPSRTEDDYSFYLRRMEIRKDHEEEGHGKPLHYIGVSLNFPRADEMFTSEKIESGDFWCESGRFSEATCSPRIDKEGEEIMRIPDIEIMMRDWTKVLICWLTNQSVDSIEQYETRMMARHMMAIPAPYTSPQSFLVCSFMYTLPEYTRLAFQKGLSWTATAFGIPVLQHFVMAMLFPVDWVHLYWGCHGFVCCLSASTGSAHFCREMRAITDPLTSMLSRPHRERFSFILTHVCRLFFNKIGVHKK